MFFKKASINHAADHATLKCTALLLCLVLSVSLVSCGKGGSDAGVTSGPADTSPLPETDSGETVYIHSGDPDNEVRAEAYLKALPERNFNGAEFFITSSDTTMLDPDGVELVSDTVTRRNAALEEKYNISVRTEKADPATMIAEAEKAYMAGTYYTDIMAIPFEETGVFASADVLMNLRSLPLFDPDQPYFNSSSVNALSAGYMTYGIAGEATPASLDLPVVVFNKTLLGSALTAEVYSEALDGRFTWDRFFELAALCDTSAEAGSICTTGAPATYIYASLGSSFVSSGEKTVPSVSVARDSMDTASSYLKKIFYVGTLGAVTPEMAPSAFSSGKALLSICSMRELDAYRSPDVKMGILPMPKKDAESEYRSLVGGGSLVLTVAAGSTNAEMVSLALQGLCAASYGYITDKYVNYLHATTLPDGRSADILDLISDSAYYDFTTAFSKAVPALSEGTTALVADIMNTGDFSRFDSLTGAANRALSSAFPLKN